VAAFFLNKDKNKTARKLGAKLSVLEKNIPEKLEKKLKKEDYEVLELIVKESFASFSASIQAKLRILFDEVGFIDYIFSKLENNREKAVIKYLDLLAILKTKKAFRKIIICLKSKREAVNFEAAYTLIEIKDQRTIKYMVDELINEESEILPARIGQVLIGLAPQSIPYLMNIYDDLPLKAQQQVLEIFMEVKDKRTLSIIEDILINGDASSKVLAASALAEFGVESSKTYLEKALKDKDRIVRETAKSAMKLR
jgi:HEAT repeat protein